LIPRAQVSAVLDYLGLDAEDVETVLITPNYIEVTQLLTVQHEIVDDVEEQAQADEGGEALEPEPGTFETLEDAQRAVQRGHIRPM